jgi:hypothetical protein
MNRDAAKKHPPERRGPADRRAGVTLNPILTAGRHMRKRQPASELFYQKEIEPGEASAKTLMTKVIESRTAKKKINPRRCEHG